MILLRLLRYYDVIKSLNLDGKSDSLVVKTVYVLDCG